MKELINYIKKYENCTFKEMPFNEVDSLIYSTLCYNDFRGIVTKPISIKDAYNLFQNKFLSKTKDSFAKQNALLFKTVAASKRFQDNILERYENVTNNKTQFGALTIKVPHQFKYIAFLGTDDLLTSWEEDFRMSFEYPVIAQKLALKYLEKEIKFGDVLVYVGGHSKGGNLACYACMHAKFSKRLRVKYIFNFDGPGFFKEIIESKTYRRIEKKIRNYYPEQSVVGMMLTSNGKKKIVKSTAFRINQHNPHSWKFDLDSFDYGELSSYSKGFHKKVDRLIQEISFEDRKKFVNTFFNLLYSAGYNTKAELTQLSLTKFRNMIKGAINLNEADKKLILNVIKVFTKEEAARKENAK